MTDLNQLKMPPHNLEAEQAVLGAMLLNPGCISKVQKELNSEDFYSEVHMAIADAIFELKSKASIITVCEFLRAKDLPEQSIESDYIASLVENTTVSSGVSHHAGIIKELSDRRKIIHSCSDSINMAYDLSRDIDSVLSEHKGSIRDIQSDQKDDFRPNSELVRAVFEDIENRAQSGNHFVGIKTGFQNIDIHLNGLEPKTTTYLPARPSMGKTCLALNIGDYVAVNYDGKVIYFSLESGDVALTRRRLSAHSGVFLSRLRTGDILDSQWRDLIESADILSGNNLSIIDKPKYKTIENLISLSESLAMESPLSLIIIDHVQRMKTRKKAQNRHLELSYISEEISSLAKDLDIPILILCQLNREIEKRRDQRPKLFDMKESGDLEANADVVISLYRQDNESEIMEVECLKGRDTGTWKTYLKFDRFTQKITDYKDVEQYEPPGEKIPQRGYEG